MSNIPLVFTIGGREAKQAENGDLDAPIAAEPLPAVLELDGSGFVLSRETRMTEVTAESVDER